MNGMVQKIVLQGVLFGSVSLGSYITQKIFVTTNHKFIEETLMLKQHKDLCEVLTKISLLGSDKIFEYIVKNLDETLVNYSLKKCSLWSANRSFQKFLNLSLVMKKNAALSRDVELITHAIDFEKEYYNQFSQQLDIILHNILLDSY